MPRNLTASDKPLMKSDPLHGRSAEALKASILIWEILKTHKMTNQQLSEILGLSRTNIKDRLRRLQTAGLVDPVGNVKTGKRGTTWSFLWGAKKRALDEPLKRASAMSNPISGASPASPEATTSSEEKQAAR